MSCINSRKCTLSLGKYIYFFFLHTVFCESITNICEEKQLYSNVDSSITNREKWSLNLTWSLENMMNQQHKNIRGRREAAAESIQPRNDS